ncbi:MAG: NINE protein [Thermogutta sp.]
MPDQPIYFNCTACGRQLKVAPRTAGKRATCPACGATLVVPGPQPPPLNDPVFAKLEPEPAPAAGNTKFCFHCGAVIAAPAEICPRCGVLQPAPAGAGSTSPNRVVAALLAIFLGSLGAHKFYLGNIWMGVLYLIVSVGTCGIGAIVIALIAIIEGLVYLTYTDEKFAAVYGRR